MSNESAKQGRLRATQKEATGKAVLEAARAEFERVGFEAANLRAIAARAGVSAGTVLHHYGDKRDLLHAALFDDLDATLRKAISEPGAGPLEKQLSRLTRAVFGYYQQRPRLSRTLLKESLFAEEPWARKFTAQAGRVHGALARLAVDASARGELRPDVDGALFAVAYLSFFYFALIAWVQGAHAAPESMVDHLVLQHLEGLRPTKKPRRRKSP
ncbi:TetR/AcrR family transcriptional regulator [Pyxidicoccus sp. 3LG]